MLSFRVSMGAISALFAVCCLLVSPSRADDKQMPPIKVDVLQKGASTSKVMEQALADLPLDQLPTESRQRVETVLKNRSLFRRLPTIGMGADPAVYHFFTRNPEAAVGVWRVMEISQFKLNQVAPMQWKGDAGDGSNGSIEILHRTASRQLLLCEGEYKSPVLPKPIKAQAVMHLRTDYPEKAQANHNIVHDVDLFVTFPSQTVETVAKVIAPVSNSIADKNFRELSMFVEFMSTAMHTHPGWVEQVVQRMDGVKNDQKEEFLKVAATVFVASRKNELQQNGVQNASFEDLIAPYQGPKR